MSYIGQRPVVGRYIKLDQISSGFNGSNTGFSMTAGSQAVFPGTARNLLLSLGGVIQEPDTDFTISGSTLTFTTPPVANTTFFGVIYGDMQATGTPSDGTVLPASIASSGHFKIPQLTVNEDGADVDFRVEGDTDVNLLFGDASTDRVGIGLSSPTVKLDVAGSLRLQSGGATRTLHMGPSSAGIEYNVNGTTFIQGRTDAYPLAFKTQSAERMRINSSGHVGIGTTSPSYRLSVEAASGTDVTALFKSDDANAWIQIRDNTTTDTGVMVGANGDNLLLRAGSNTRMYLKSDGNVGIGTTSPGSELHVSALGASDEPTIRLASENSTIFLRTAGSSGSFPTGGGGDDGELTYIGGNFRLGIGTASKNLIFFNGSGYIERMRIDSSGRVGIGQSTNLGSYDSSADRLVVGDGSGDEGITIVSGQAVGNNGSIFFADGTGSTNSKKGQIRYEQNTEAMKFATNGSERLRIDINGNVGIGTSSPTGRLNLAVGASTACVLRLTANNTGSGAGDRGRIEVFSSKNDGTAFEAGQIVIDRNSTTEAKAKFQLFLNNDSGVEKAFEISPDKNVGFNGSSAASCAIDIEGDQVDIGNPLGNGVSNGINPTFRALVVNKNIVFSSMWGGDNQLHKHLQFSGGANIFYVGTNDAEIARTNANGLVIGSTSFDSNNSIGVRLFAHGAIHSTRDSEYAYVGRRSNSNGGMFLFRRDSTDVGNISVTTSATSYNSGSDYRLKQDDTPLIDGLTRLKQLKPIKFKWKNDTSQFVDGFFAHEVSSIVPNAITGEKDAVYEKDDELGHKKGDPIYQQIDHGKLVPLLVAALQEEIVKREELEARVAALEAA